LTGVGCSRFFAPVFVIPRVQSGKKETWGGLGGPISFVRGRDFRGRVGPEFGFFFLVWFVVRFLLPGVAHKMVTKSSSTYGFGPACGQAFGRREGVRFRFCLPGRNFSLTTGVFFVSRAPGLSLRSPGFRYVSWAGSRGRSEGVGSHLFAGVVNSGHYLGREA